MSQSSGRGQGPRPSRPQMPEGYGIPEGAEGMQSWDDIRERLAGTRIYWVGTTRPDGRPHVVPIWGAWVDDRFYFEGSPETRRGRNLGANPAIVVHCEHDNLAIMVEGVVEVVDLDPALFRRVADSFSSRYSYRPEAAAGWYVARPRVAFAWNQFPRDATRWHFE